MQIRRVALLIGVVAAANAVAADQSLCFAFLRSGYVVISCDGRGDKITRQGNLNSFAVAEEQGILGVVTSFIEQGFTSSEQQGIQITPGSRTLQDLVRMTELRSGKSLVSKARGNVPTLMSTCGGFFGEVDSKRQPLRRELLKGTDVAIDPYTWFRCSVDRRVVAGIQEHDRTLYEGMPPQTRVAEARSVAYYEFNISPNGKYLAFASDRQPLCVWSAEGGAQCAESADAVDSSHDLVSVRDDGEVLVSLATADKCVFKSPTIFSPAKPNDPKAMRCFGIGHWRPGMKSPEIVEPLGRAPQWISPETANLLRQGARKAYFGNM